MKKAVSISEIRSALSGMYGEIRTARFELEMLGAAALDIKSQQGRESAAGCLAAVNFNLTELEHTLSKLSTELFKHERQANKH